MTVACCEEKLSVRQEHTVLHDTGLLLLAHTTHIGVKDRLVTRP